MTNYEKVRSYLQELEYNIVSENETDKIFVVEKASAGIINLLLECEDPILVMEQHLFDLPKIDAEILQKLLIKNREIVHGAFVLDETGHKVIFRDTLQLENLDLNELQASIISLEILLSEFAGKIISFSK